MELPSFDILWAASQKLDELESTLVELDRTRNFKKARRSTIKGRGLYGVRFDAENENYYIPLKHCCDQGFYTIEEYDKHVGMHITCPVESCPFTSDYNAMRLHKEVVHDSGLFATVYSGNSDKEIQKWREERKRNYPTAERTAVRTELLKQRLARGQIFETRRFPSVNTKRDLGVLTTIRSTCNQDVTHSKQEACTESQIESLVPTDYGSDSSICSSPKKVEQLCVISAGNSKSRRNRNPSTAERTQSQNTPSTVNRRRCRNRRKKNTTATCKDHVNNSPFASHPVVKLQVKRKQCISDINRIHSRPTLLQMLLAEDIRKERNQLMQCIRYVIKENFFRATQSKEREVD